LLCRFGDRESHRFRQFNLEDRVKAFGDEQSNQARSRPRRPEAYERCGAGFAAGTGQNADVPRSSLMHVGLARFQPLGEEILRQPVAADTRRAGQFGRDSDIDHPYFAHQFVPRFEDVADFEKTEGGRGIRPYCSPQRLPGARVQSRRNVHRQHRHPQAVYPFDNFAVKPPDFGLQPRAENGIDDDVTVFHLTPLRLEVSGFVPDVDRNPDLPDYAKIGERIARKFFRGAKTDNLDHCSPVVENPGQHEAVPAVVPPARDDDDTALGKIGHNFEKKSGGAPGGVFHEHHPGNPDPVDCLLIECGHLLSSQDQHCDSSFAR